MRSLKVLSVLLMALGLIGFIGGTSPLIADETDAPHQTHLTHVRGPGITDCSECHNGTPAYDNVNTGACAACHGPGGVWDGVNDTDVGALNNWDNMDDPGDAVQSLIYDSGKLKSGKDKWCATCHDQSATGADLIDDFEGYADDAELQSVWKAAKDATVSIQPFYSAWPLHGISGQYMRVDLQETSTGFGRVTRTFSPALDLSGKEYFGFYVKVHDKTKLNKIVVWLRINGSWSTSSIKVNTANGFKNDHWKLVLLHKGSFSNGWGSADKVQFKIVENEGIGRTYVFLDEVGADMTGSNVTRDNVNAGFYVTGHGTIVNCTWCHDANSEHVDGKRLPFFDYIREQNNPTNFRFYSDDPRMGMQLPYVEYVPGPEGAFALCYRCHDEECITQDAPAEELMTNFTDIGYIPAGPENLHLYHVDGVVGPPEVYAGTCVACHDPHGQANPAMSRREMGNFIYFDANGCEIQRGADSNGNGIDDWHDPEVNMGGAQTENGSTYDPLCIVCHTIGVPPNPDCQGQNPYIGGGGMNGWYARTYKDACTSPVSATHQTHFNDPKGPMLGEQACHVCHDVSPIKNACMTCHSPHGAFPGPNGLDDPTIGAWTNWADGVYEADGTTLQSGKEQWCATCHDDVPASSRPGPGIEVVVDNSAADFECEWGTSSSGGYNNGDYRWHGAGTGLCTATWTPDLPAADTYNVSAWWKASPNRATDAKYTIYYDGGSDTVQVNQEINGDQWNLLGTYPFAAGTSGYVVLTDDANEYVVADAIKLDNGSGEISILAPNVIGDNLDYGFYVSGHNINCLSCHDAGKNHIDHEHRTYDVDDATYAAINPYGDSYRLQVTSNKASSALCFVCHNSTEVLGASSSDVSHTNFWNDDASIANSHWLHVISFTGIHFDSDWDGAIDSTESCITCHNVHGSPTEAMIRHGELISSYGTTDKVPALNFAYLVPATEFDTATWTPDLAADTYSVYARWKASSNRATNARYTIYYDGGSESVVVNQQINGDQWNLLGNYPFAAGTSGYVELTDEGASNFVIADAVGWDTDGGAPDVVVDDGDPGFATVGDWTCPSGSGGYGDDYCYAIATPGPDPDAGVEDSVGGRMNYAGPGVADNGVCHACHGAISYYRPPYLGPRVIMGQAAPDTVANDGTGTSLITVFVSDPDGDVSSVELDLTPIGGSANQAMNNDGGGYYSYEVTIPDGTPDSPLTFEITATDAAANTGEGEAKLTVVDPDSIYVDNPDADFECEWGTSATGGYRDDYRWHAADHGLCTATWTPTVPAADTYNVYAWWRVSSNRATDAPYTIYYDGGSVTVDVNQEVNGDQWNLLGTFPFAAGTSGYVVLSDDANEYVIADAIKFEP